MSRLALTPEVVAELDQVGRIKGTSSNFIVRASCTDNEDGVELALAEINGVEVHDGERVRLTLTSRERDPRYRNGKLIIKASDIELTVTCMDAADNVATATTQPDYGDDD